MKCIYCLKEKSDESFSIEHIIPQACGGLNLTESLFRTDRVCERCNNLCGLFVDSGFLKSWFMANSKAEISFRYASLQHGGIIQPSYLGMLSDISTTDELCDFWVFPLGSRVYHFYPGEENFQTFAGGNPINKRKGKGLAFLMLSQEVTKDKTWLAKTIMSFMNFFQPSDLYAYNFGMRGESEAIKIKEIDGSVSEYLSKIELIKHLEHQTQISINLDVGNRFYSKIALGVGFNIYGEDFLSMPYTVELSKALWYRPGKERPQVQGQDLILGKNNLPPMAIDLYNWNFGNILTIFPTEQGLALAMGFFGKFATLMILSKNTSQITPTFSIPQDGITYLWSTDNGFKIGPIDFIEYAAHRLNEIHIAPLNEFESKFSK